MIEIRIKEKITTNEELSHNCMLQLQRRCFFASVISKIHISLNFKPQLAQKGGLKMQGDSGKDVDGKALQLDIPAMGKPGIYILN